MGNLISIKLNFRLWKIIGAIHLRQPLAQPTGAINLIYKLIRFSMQIPFSEFLDLESIQSQLWYRSWIFWYIHSVCTIFLLQFTIHSRKTWIWDSSTSPVDIDDIGSALLMTQKRISPFIGIIEPVHGSKYVYEKV